MMFFTAFLTACGGGNSEPVATTPTAAFSPATVVFEGDSLTEINKGTNWPTAVQAASTWTATWQNHAVSGSTTAHIIARYPGVLKPSGTTGVLIINGGTNDLTLGSAPADVYARLKTEWAQARADGFRVVATTIHNARTSRERVAHLNALIRSNPSLYDALAENDKAFPDPLDTALLSDELHYTPAGNVRAAATVQSALARLR